jgi:hypothetical protein
MVINPATLPFVTDVPQDGRSILVTAFYDHNAKKWHSYVPTEDKKLLSFPVVELVEGIYIAKQAFSEDDFYLPFGTFMLQHLAIGHVPDIHEKIFSDLVNGLSSIHQYFVNLKHENTTGDRAICTCIVPTNLEYALMNFRAFFDLINQVVAEVLQHVIGKKNNHMPESFRKVVQKDVDQLRNNYGFSDPLINFYKAEEKIFLAFRALRDQIVHQGKTVDLFFHFPEGFAVSTEAFPFNSLKCFNIWPTGKLKANAVGSLLPLLAFMLRHMFEALDRLSESLRSSFQKLPTATSAGFSIFGRSRTAIHLKNCEMYLSEHWLQPDAVLLPPSPA